MWSCEVAKGIAFLPSVTTIYTVTGINSFGCISSQTTNIIVNPNPIIFGLADSVIICYGKSVTLNSQGASTYTWYPEGINGNSITVTTSASAVYTVIGSNGFGC